MLASYWDFCCNHSEKGQISIGLTLSHTHHIAIHKE